MKNNLDIESELKKIESRFNHYLDNCSRFYDNIFIIKMNSFLSQFPSNIVEQYRWMRNGGTQKPALYFQNLNRIIKYHAKKNKYTIIKPYNLDVFLN